MKNKKFWIISVLFLIFAGVAGFFEFSSDGAAVIVKSWSSLFAPQADLALSDDNAVIATDAPMPSSSVEDATDSAIDAKPSTKDVGVVQQEPEPEAVPPTDLSNAADPETPVNSGGADASTNVPAKAASVPVASTSKAPPEICSLSNLGLPSRRVILNEIAWMGSLPQAGETTAKAGNREWIELKNISPDAIDVSGWQIVDASGNLKIILAAGTIPAGGFYVLARGGALASSTAADADYSGGLSNAGNRLALFDADCGVSDSLDASAGWPGGDNATKQTLERNSDGVGWHTSALPGGTARAENSIPVLSVAAASSSVSMVNQDPAPRYLVSVSFIGAGTGTISSTPAGIFCGFNCQASYAAGTKINFTQTPAAGSLFSSWSGPCGGAEKCSFVVSSSIAVVADFEPIEVPLSVAVAPTIVPLPTSTPSTQSLGHLEIVQIQISGASSSNDFVKIFNPTAASVDLSGWKLRKKSSTGTDVSLRTFSSGSAIASGGYFMWANSAGGFAQSIGADVSSTETLSAENSVALMDAAGNIIDAVAWGTGTNQYVEGAAFPTDPTANQILSRKLENGAFVDTENNESDFAIQ